MHTYEEMLCKLSDELYDLNDSSSWDIHVITSALKLFFRELREPVISTEFCDNFLRLNGKSVSVDVDGID